MRVGDACIVTLFGSVEDVRSGPYPFVVRVDLNQDEDGEPAADREPDPILLAPGRGDVHPIR